MARAIRKKIGTGVYHVMLRGINRQDIFVTGVYPCEPSLGAGVRQLSRLTGVSYGVVQKLTK